MDYETKKSLEYAIKEHCCSDVDNSSGILRINFGKNHIVIQSVWRIVRNEEIIATSESDSERIKSKLFIVKNLYIEKIDIKEPFNDIELQFSGGIHLQTFADSEIFEHWHFFGDPQEMVVAGPGKLWSCFETR